ncbi:hypothetical protein C5167_016733 [Papaver somniferum]|uniref:RING-H2 finger protein ATL2-like n=1 Tax=Papaver somniferum TaxID=3469 RepID=UPI000E6F879A|nr:RING-H2 finger protein ATL2-like [Papaver somniferum]RZC94039.1 hypothetical protein C5167_016733 [Papaver somniferum]
MSDDDLNFSQRGGYVSTPRGYALSGKIMLSAIIILFTVVILIVCFHIYARWFLQHHRPQPSNLSSNRRRRRHRRTHRTHFIFTSNPLPGDTVFSVSRGLDSNVLKSIPIFTYSATTHKQKDDQNGGGAAEDGDHDVLECAVCLSGFEENEIGRILPKCKHSFHVECIDMWFHSHSTCPLCRTPVTPETATATTESSSAASERATIHELTQIVIDSSEEQGSSTSNQPCTSCRNEGSSSSVSGSGSSLSFVSPLSIEVRKPEESNLKSLVEETGGQQGLKSPGSRMLSLKRILSREKRMSSMSNSLSFCSYVTDNTVDRDEENQVQVQQTR